MQISIQSFSADRSLQFDISAQTQEGSAISVPQLGCQFVHQVPAFWQGHSGS